MAFLPISGKSEGPLVAIFAERERERERKMDFGFKEGFVHRIKGLYINP